MNYKKILILCLAAVFTSLAFGSKIKPSKNLYFSSIRKTVGVETKNGVCSFAGKRVYQVRSNKNQTRYDLVCKVREPGFEFDSEIPVELIQGFHYPDSILKDMKDWQDMKETDIATKKQSWGSEYTWSTPSTGSTKYHYLCFAKSDECLRAKVSGLEELAFTVR